VELTDDQLPSDLLLTLSDGTISIFIEITLDSEH
jgi:hypothetical protein